MGTFRQLGDPVCPACLCQHSGAAYAEIAATVTPYNIPVIYDQLAAGTVIISRTIVTTERCCIVANAAVALFGSSDPTQLRLERPTTVDRTTQRDKVDSNTLRLVHLAAWEVLDPGTYEYSVRKVVGSAINHLASWLKVVASDCEG